MGKVLVLACLSDRVLDGRLGEELVEDKWDWERDSGDRELDGAYSKRKCNSLSCFDHAPHLDSLELLHLRDLVENMQAHVHTEPIQGHG